MSTSGLVWYYLGWAVNPLIPRKYSMFGLDLHHVVQKRNPDIIWDLPVFIFIRQDNLMMGKWQLQDSE